MLSFLDVSGFSMRQDDLTPSLSFIYKKLLEIDAD